MRNARWGISVALAAVAFGAAAPAATGVEPGAAARAPLRLTLDEAIRRAVLTSGEVDAAAAGLRAAEARVVRARGGGLPSLEATLVAGPSPRARGDQVSSPDDQDRPVVTGVFGRAEVQLVQPLYTFGRLPAARAAAEAGVEAAQADLLARAAETSQRTIQAYLGLLLARDSLGLVTEVQGEIDGALARRRERTSEPGDVDVLRLETFAAEAERGRVEAEAGVRSAAVALAVLVDAPPGVAVEPAEPSLAQSAPAPGGERPALDAFLAGLEARRPELAQLRAGLEAREAEARLAAAERRPALFLLGIADVAGATNRDSLDNPYVVDPLNHLQAGVVVGLRWAFDFGASGRLGEARAEAARLAGLQVAARRGLPLEVRRAYVDLERALGEVAATERAFRSARRWTAAAATAADLGFAELKDAEDAFREYARHRADYFRALYNVRLAEANLRHAAGLDAEALAPLVRRAAR